MDDVSLHRSVIAYALDAVQLEACSHEDRRTPSNGR